MTNKFVAFFATPNGQTTSAVAVLVATSSALLAKYLPNSLLVEQSREFLQLFKGGLPVPVSAETIQKINQVKSDLRLEEDVANRIPTEKAFTVFGFDVLHIGSATFKTGALLGIPVNFSYKSSISEADKKKIVVGQQTVHWSSPEGLALESSLILSDSAQKYAIAREMAKANTHHVAIQTGLNGAAVFVYYYLTYTFNRRANMFARPLKLRVVLYSLLGSIAFTTWLFLKDFTTYRWEEKGDEKAASVSEEYAQGALEFYSKILQRNLAMRSLLGDEGPKLYTSSGNDRETFRTKHVPFVVLRDRAAARCESFKKSKEPEVPTPT